MVDVVAFPRVAFGIRCPYCRHETSASCRRPADHSVLVTCHSCFGDFVVHFDVEIRTTVLSVQGEHERVAAEQAELLELERQRNAAGE